MYNIVRHCIGWRDRSGCKCGVVIVSAVPPTELHSFVEMMRSYRDSEVRFIINLPDCTEESLLRFEVLTHEAHVTDFLLLVVQIKGSKSLFWKKIVTPEHTGMKLVWLIDSDMHFAADQFK